MLPLTRTKAHACQAVLGVVTGLLVLSGGSATAARTLASDVPANKASDLQSKKDVSTQKAVEVSSWKSSWLDTKGDSTFSQARGNLAARSKFSSAAAVQVSVIITLDGPLTPSRCSSLAALEASITQNLPFIQAVSVKLPPCRLQALAALPFVMHLSRDGVVQKCDEFTVASSGAGTAFQQYGLTGQGIGVAVVDSGVRAVQDLANPNNRVVSTVSCIPGDASPDDTCGHGTHVAGIIGGNGLASTGFSFKHTYYGIARGANIVSVRVLDKNGQSTVTTVLSGIQWVIANKKAKNIRVMNLSLGHPICESYATDPLCKAVEAAWKAGIVVVCAAGNGGRLNAVQGMASDNEGWGTAYGSVQSPANDPYVITVGATKQIDAVRADDRIATYSGRGPSVLDLIAKPDLVAPGNHIVSLYSFGSTLYQWASSSGNGLPMSGYASWGGSSPSTDYFVLSGTSMASPVVAGAAALLLQQNPALTPDAVKARLMVSADKAVLPDGTADPLTYGAGYLNIPAALACTVMPTTAALSPRLYLDASGNLAVEMDPNVFGASAIWGPHAIWGTTTLTDMHAIWGSRAMWGSASDTAASRAMWGSTGVSEQQALWGSRAMWGTSTVDASRAMWGTSGNVDLSATALFGE